MIQFSSLKVNVIITLLLWVDNFDLQILTEPKKKKVLTHVQMHML